MVRSVDPNSHWTNNEELLAVIAELVDSLIQLFYAANTRKGAKPLTPLRIPRPGREEPLKPKPTPTDLRRFFGRSLHVIKDANGS